MNISKKFELFGEKWEVLVKENVHVETSGPVRSVIILNVTGGRKRFHKNKKRAKHYLIKSNEELPPVGEHVAETVNEAMKKYLKQQEEQITKEQAVENAIETSTEIWEQGLTDIEQNS